MNNARVYKYVKKDRLYCISEFYQFIHADSKDIFCFAILVSFLEVSYW